MFEWFIEVILILVILVQYYFSKKKTDLEPSEPNETSRDFVVCKTGKIWHYKDCECVLSDEKTAFMVELPDRESRVRESSRTRSGRAPGPGPGQLPNRARDSFRPVRERRKRSYCLLLTAGR